MAVATAGVAGLAGTTTVAASSAAATVGVAEARLGAVAGNVTHLAALYRWVSLIHMNIHVGLVVANLVALSRATSATARGTTHGAVTGDVAGLAALVARLVVLHGLSAVTAWIR